MHIRSDIKYLKNSGYILLSILKIFLTTVAIIKNSCLCLTHLQLLALNPNTAILANTLIEICKEYWSCVLLIDDIMDAKQDIETQTLTQLIVRYWHCYESMPTEHDIHVLMQDGDQELGYLVEKIDRLAFKTGFFDFMDNIYFLVDKARQASA